jgi:hypothetical protein
VKFVMASVFRKNCSIPKYGLTESMVQRRIKPYTFQLKEELDEDPYVWPADPCRKFGLLWK